MKKNTLKKIIAAIVASAALFYIPAISGYCGIVNFDYETATATYSQVEGTAIYVEDGFSEEKMGDAIVGWTMVPAGVRVKLVEYGCGIYLSVTAQPEEGSNVVGLAHNEYSRSYNSETLEITGVTCLSYIICLEKSSSLQGTVLHEAGHVLDKTISALSDQYYSESSTEISEMEEWKDIYAAYKDQLAAIDSHTALNMYNTAEAFAECFRLTYQNPEALIAVCPAAYEFVLRMVEMYAPEG